jgi:hypothetical protein
VLWAGQPGYRGDPHGRELDPALAAITPDQVGRAADRALRVSQLSPGELAALHQHRQQMLPDGIA